MRILIVDDEFVCRETMLKIMQEFGQCETAEDGTEAIATFQMALEEGEPFDLITLDISMPVIDGTSALSTIREMEREKNIPKQEQVKVIMVTLRSEKDSVVTCIQAGCNDYVVKPFNFDTMREKLNRLGLSLPPGTPAKKDIQPASPESTAGKVEDIIANFKPGQINLPSLPQISIKFKELFNKGADISEVANLLKQDMAISAKLINLSNSVVYKGTEENKTMEQAIGRLGLATTKQYVDTISNRAVYNKINKKYIEYVDALWKHSLACAYASQSVAEIISLEETVEIFTVALLHDIGKIILLQIVSKFEDEGKYVDGIDSEELYKSIDIHHCIFGATLFNSWGFSDRYIQTALYHNHPENADTVSKDLLVVHFANLLVKSIGYCAATQSGKDIDFENDKSAEMLGLKAEMVSEVKDKVRTRMTELSKIVS